MRTLIFAAAIATVDANQDGKVTAEELAAAMARMRQGGWARQGPDLSLSPAAALV